MKIALCYIVVAHGRKTEEYVSRFVRTYHDHPPGAAHDTVIIANGGAPKSELAAMLCAVGGMVFPRINDSGWDISGYIAAANGPCAAYDMMLCLGESNYFHRSGWLKRIVEAWRKHGAGMYGPYATNIIRAHLLTTAFCCHPEMLRKYPAPVKDRKSRYEFEHGVNAFWRRLDRAKFPVRLVTWDGEWQPRAFRVPKNILWRGDQSNLLMFCNHCDRWNGLSAERKRNWSNSADRAFQ